MKKLIGVRRIRSADTLLLLFTIVFLVQSIYGYRGSQRDALGPPLGHITGVDFEQILVASNDIVAGENLYRRALLSGKDPTFEKFISPIPSPYPYMPIVAVLALPLTHVSTQTALELWSVINLAMLAVSAWLAATIFGNRGQRSSKMIRFVFVFTVFFMSKQTQHNLQLVQLDIFIVCMLTCSYVLFQRGNKYLAGIPFAFALVTKILIFPILFYYLWKRSWQTVVIALIIAGILFALGFFVVGLERLPDYLEVNRLWATGKLLVLPFNQSLRGLSLRAFTINDYIEPLVDAPWLASIVPIMGGVVAIAAWPFIVSRTSFNHARVGVEYGLTILTAMSLSPLVDDIHVVWALVPMVALLLTLIDRVSDWRTILAASAAFGLALYLGYPGLGNAIYSGGLDALATRSLVPANKVFLTGVYTYGLITLYLFTALHLLAVRTRSDTTEQLLPRALVDAAPENRVAV